MWIFDSTAGAAWVMEPWKELGRVSTVYPTSFYMHLKDPHAHWEMIDGLENRYKVEGCSFNTIIGSFEGHRIYASRKVAEKIEIQTSYAVEALQRGRQTRSTISDRRTYSLVEAETCPGSRLTSRIPWAAWRYRWLEIQALLDEALKRSIAVPLRKRDAESIMNISELKASDKGGMIFQPEPGV
jgi:hypothetical protein